MYNTLAAYTTFGIGGRAERIEIAVSREALTELSQTGLVIGRGSDILVGDGGYDGLVVINRYESVEQNGCVVTVGSGTRLSVLCERLYELGLSGLEWAAGIPGSVGGAVKMNAGAFGGCVADSLVYAEFAANGRAYVRTRDELEFAYRRGPVAPGETVISAAFELVRSDPASIRSRMNEYARRRNATQPRGKTAGSIFKNPAGASVGKLLDEAGLKGLRRGGAMISREHANMIVNVGGATARNVVELIAEMKDALLERNVAATEEIVYIGNFQ